MSEYMVELHEQQETKYQKWLATLPVCDECGEPIQDEEFYLVNDIKICPTCMERVFKKNTDDYTQSEEW